MKSFMICVSIFLFTGNAAARMMRVAQVTSSNTIVLEGGKSVTLRGVLVPADEEAAARDYLAQLVAGRWVAIENGDVFRSPDALFINGELARRAYLAPNVHMTYLGELNPAPRPESRATAPQKRAAPARGFRKRR
jgi:hypothetical protein